MPVPNIRELRSNFLGGLNVTGNPDTLQPDELLQCVNARIEPFGGIMRRPGSKILVPDTSILDGQLIHGIHHWNGPSGPQIVALVEALLFHAVEPYSALVAGAGANGFNKGQPATFSAFRAAAPGAPLHLYIADGMIFSFDGTTSTQRSGTNNVPFSTAIKAFGTRMFANDTGEIKKIKWSKIGDATDFRTGGISGGGVANADILTGDALTALEAVGSSLLISTAESIARFTGTGEDIQLLQDSQGVSTEIGALAEYAIVRADGVAFLLSERGPYVATEGGVLFLGNKIVSPEQTTLTMPFIPRSAPGGGIGYDKPIVGKNGRRSEVWFAYAPVGTVQDNGKHRTHCLVYNTKRRCWYGPFIYPFGISSFGSFENTSGVESIMAGCDDGKIRLLDDPTASSFDDGITDFDAIVEFAPFGHSEGPQTTKSLEHVSLQGIGPLTFRVTVEGDLGLTDNGVFIG